MTKFPGPWKVEWDRIVASDGSIVVRTECCVKLLMEPEAEQMLLAVPMMRDLLDKPDSPPAPPSGTSQLPLPVGSRFRFKPMNHPQKLLYRTTTDFLPGSTIYRASHTGRRFTVNRTKVAWHAMNDDDKISAIWTETMEGGIGGKWSRQREGQLDLRVPDERLRPDSEWTVLTVGGNGFFITAESSSVQCTFFLGEDMESGRPLSSLECVIK